MISSPAAIMSLPTPNHSAKHSNRNFNVTSGSGIGGGAHVNVNVNVNMQGVKRKKAPLSLGVYNSLGPNQFTNLNMASAETSSGSTPTTTTASVISGFRGGKLVVQSPSSFATGMLTPQQQLTINFPPQHVRSRSSLGTASVSVQSAVPSSAQLLSSTTHPSKLFTSPRQMRLSATDLTSNVHAALSTNNTGTTRNNLPKLVDFTTTTTAAISFANTSSNNNNNNNSMKNLTNIIPNMISATTQTGVTGTIMVPRQTSTTLMNENQLQLQRFGQVKFDKFDSLMSKVNPPGNANANSTPNSLITSSSLKQFHVFNNESSQQSTISTTPAPGIIQSGTTHVSQHKLSIASASGLSSSSNLLSAPTATATATPPFSTRFSQQIPQSSKRLSLFLDRPQSMQGQPLIPGVSDYPPESVVVVQDRFIDTHAQMKQMLKKNSMCVPRTSDSHASSDLQFSYQAPSTINGFPSSASILPSTLKGYNNESLPARMKINSPAGLSSAAAQLSPIKQFQLTNSQQSGKRRHFSTFDNPSNMSNGLKVSVENHELQKQQPISGFQFPQKTEESPLKRKMYSSSINLESIVDSSLLKSNRAQKLSNNESCGANKLNHNNILLIEENCGMFSESDMILPAEYSQTNRKKKQQQQELGKNNIASESQAKKSAQQTFLERSMNQLSQVFPLPARFKQLQQSSVNSSPSQQSISRKLGRANSTTHNNSSSGNLSPTATAAPSPKKSVKIIQFKSSEDLLLGVSALATATGGGGELSPMRSPTQGILKRPNGGGNSTVKHGNNAGDSRRAIEGSHNTGVTFSSSFAEQKSTDTMIDQLHNNSPARSRNKFSRFQSQSERESGSAAGNVSIDNSISGSSNATDQDPEEKIEDAIQQLNTNNNNSSAQISKSTTSIKKASSMMIDIEKELMESKLRNQRNHQNDVLQLISTIQNNALENVTSEQRMQQSKKYKLEKRKSRIMEETKLQRQQQFLQNLEEIKERNSYQGQEVALLEAEFASGGMFSAKNFNNLRINRNSKRTRKKIKVIFMNTIKLLLRLDLNPEEVMANKIFSSKPFEKKNSHQMFVQLKANDVEQVTHYLRLDKYLVYDYDYLFMTPLHWACKRGLLKMASVLIRYKSDIDAEDLMGRTPLSFAIENDFEDIVELLLVNKASPLKTKYVDYVKLTKNYIVHKMLEVSRKLHWAVQSGKIKSKGDQWQKEIGMIYLIRQQQQYQAVKLKAEQEKEAFKKQIDQQ